MRIIVLLLALAATACEPMPPAPPNPRWRWEFTSTTLGGGPDVLCDLKTGNLVYREAHHLAVVPGGCK